MSLVGIYHVLAILLADVVGNWPIPVAIVVALSFFMDHTITLDVIGGLTGVLLYKVVDAGKNVKVDLIVALGALLMRSTFVALLASVLTGDRIIVGTTLAIWLASPWPDVAQCVALLITLATVWTRHHEVVQPPATPTASAHR